MKEPFSCPSSKEATEGVPGCVVQGQKSLTSRAYDYAVSDVPIAADVYNALDRYADMQIRHINALAAMHGMYQFDQSVTCLAFVGQFCRYPSPSVLWMLCIRFQVSKAPIHGDSVFTGYVGCCRSGQTLQTKLETLFVVCRPD